VLNRVSALCSDPARRSSQLRSKEIRLSEGHEPAEQGSLDRNPVLGIEEVNNARVVRLAGELDLYNANVVRDALLEAADHGPPERIVVDLSEVDFMDSTTLGVLIEARTKLANRKGFLLAAPGLETRRALQISGLDRHFSVHDTVEEALKTPLSS
jgi:anti-sigma B factor antagonist